jgi:dTMP kinase
VSVFVSFEGPDGAGKSTQVRLVAQILQQAGLAVVCTREPGGTPLGERVRSMLLDPGECAIVPRAEALLMTAARAQHVHDVIIPAINDGAIVLCDRYIDSTLAYQGAGRGLPVSELTALQHFATGLLQPDITFLLDLDPESGIMRRHDSGTPLNRLDQDDLAFHRRVREWYVQAAVQEPDRWVTVDASLPEHEIATRIGETILERRRAEQENAEANRTGE